MTFPWKKHRVTPISQIVAGLQSPKRGASLVVQTGFPTSLIDLFLKNRTRFTKPNSKKPVRPEISDPPPPALPLSPSPLHPPQLPETPFPSGCTVVSSEAPSLMPLVTGNIHGNDGVAVSGSEVNRVGECGGGSGSKTVLATVLKMFVVIVLITSVKELIVGITVSAFSLLFLENAGNRVVSCLRPCSDANVGIIRRLTQRVSNCVWFQKLQLKKEKDCEGSESLVVDGENMVVSELVVGAECGSNPLPFEEIEVVENKSEVVVVCCEETCFDGPELNCVNGIGDKKWGCPEMHDYEGSNVKVVDSCKISQCKTKDSRSVKLTSKMVKKLVPKKLRGSKKEKKEKRSKGTKAESSGEGSSTANEDKLPSFETQEEHDGVGRDKKENGNGSPLLPKIELECIREDEVDHGITCSKDSSLVRVDEVAVNSEEKIIGRVGDSGYTVLFVIALAGLVVGRFPALILIMAWCFMLKIVTTQGRSQNVALIKCSVPKS